MSETPQEQSDQTEQQGEGEQAEEQHVVIVGPDGQPVATVPASMIKQAASSGDADAEEDKQITDLVEQPAKVLRIGTMIKQLLEEVKAAPLDDAGRQRLKEIHENSLNELKEGLAPELVEELQRLSKPFSEGTPTEGELRIVQGQLVGWLEGLFHGIQTAIAAQQMASQAQLERIRRALPPGAIPQGQGGPQSSGAPHATPTPGDSSTGGGMYL